jgi:regulatory protein
MRARDFESEIVDELIEQLKSENLQSDSRYTEAFVHDRIGKGYGPLHILQELKQKGIRDELREEFVDGTDQHWQIHIVDVHARKFGANVPEDYKEQARQSRFLQYRGFSSEHIHRLFKKLKDHDD